MSSASGANTVILFYRLKFGQIHPLWKHIVNNHLNDTMKDPSHSSAEPDSKESLSSMRALKCEQSVLSRADGSVIYSQGILGHELELKWSWFFICNLNWSPAFFALPLTGNTVVMASVFGPLEAQLKKEIPDRMYVELNYKPKIGQVGIICS